MSSTRVIGYFNPNSHPVSIASSSLGLNITIQPKEYVKDSAGNKINDPRLETYTGPHMLAREISQKDVPVRFVAAGVAPTVPPPVSAHPTGFTASAVVPKVSARPTGVKMPPAPQTPPRGSGNPIVAMSVEEAKRRGLIKDTRRTVTGPADNESDARSAVHAPTIDYAIDVPSKSPRPTPKKVTAGGPPAAPQTPPPTPAAPPHAAPPHAAPAAVPEELIQSTLSSVIQEDEVPVAAEDEIGLDRVIDDPATEGASDGPEVTTTSDKKFICIVDGKGFDYRSQLEKWARRKYPERLDEIMAPYPPISVRGVQLA